MKRLAMTKLVRAGALADGRNGCVEIETNEGPLELRFTYEDAERLIAALHEARGTIQGERVQSGKPPLADTPKIAQSWETAVNPVNQIAVIRAHLPDHTTQDTLIPRAEIAAIAEFLGEALKRLEPGAEMRQ